MAEKEKERKEKKNEWAKGFFSSGFVVILVGFWEWILVYFFWVSAWVRKSESIHFLVGLE